MLCSPLQTSEKTWKPVVLFGPLLPRRKITVNCALNAPVFIAIETPQLRTYPLVGKWSTIPERPLTYTCEYVRSYTSWYIMHDIARGRKKEERRKEGGCAVFWAQRREGQAGQDVDARTRQFSRVMTGPLIEINFPFPRVSGSSYYMHGCSSSSRPFFLA